MTQMDAPAPILASLEQIERDLATRQPEIEAAAEAWFKAKRDREHQWAQSYMTAQGPAHLRKAIADSETALIGVESEARYEALRAVCRVLETRASVCQTLLRVQAAR